MKIKNQDMLPLADMVMESFKRDQAAFEAENKKYNVTFLNAFISQIEVLDKMEQAEALLTEQKKVTKEINGFIDTLYKPLKFLGVSMEDAKLPTKICQETIDSLRRRDMEASIDHLKSLLQIVNTNLDALTLEGMNPDTPSFLENNLKDIITKSTLQNKLKQKHQLACSTNTGSYSGLYTTYIAPICKLGKVIFFKDPKIKEYTVSELLKKVHTKGKGKNLDSDIK